MELKRSTDTTILSPLFLPIISSTPITLPSTLPIPPSLPHPKCHCCAPNPVTTFNPFPNSSNTHTPTPTPKFHMSPLPSLLSSPPIPLLPKMPSPSAPLPIRRPSPPISAAASPATTTAAAASFDLRAYWSALIPEIEAALDAAVPVRSPARVHEAMRHAVLSGGAKRSPPVLCIAACELVGGYRSAALPAACALEMVHAASLVHDDLPCMDAAPLRRGRPSTHAAFGVDLAVLAGDALFPLAFQHVTTQTLTLALDGSAVLLVLKEIARAVGSTGMAAGQFLDLTGAAAGGEEEVLLVLEKKFGEMAECSAVCGGLLGGANEEEIGALRRYGRAVGVLYQLVDDILLESDASAGKMRSNASVVRAVGMERALEIAEELRAKAKKEIKWFEDKYGDRVMPLYSFVDYAVERGFVVEGGSGDDGVSA